METCSVFAGSRFLLGQQCCDASREECVNDPAYATKKPSQVACSKSTYAGKPVPFAGGSLTGLTRVGMLSRLVLAFVGLRMETRGCICSD